MGRAFGRKRRADHGVVEIQACAFDGGATLRHLRVVLPGADNQIAHQIHTKLARGARYLQALIAQGSRYHLQRTEVDLDAEDSHIRTGGALFVTGTGSTLPSDQMLPCASSQVTVPPLWHSRMSPARPAAQSEISALRIQGFSYGAHDCPDSR